MTKNSGCVTQRPPAEIYHDSARAIFRKSLMKRSVSRRLETSSGARRRDEGCPVAGNRGAKLAVWARLAEGSRVLCRDLEISS